MLFRRCATVATCAFLAGCGGPRTGLPLTADAAAAADDSGLDGGLDSGLIDAGPFDDAGVLDSGVLDAGAVDAGAAQPLVGVLLGGSGPLPGPIAGVRFESGTVSGYTDAQGTFRYPPGGLVTFSVSDIAFRPVAGRAALSPWQLVGAGTCSQSAELERLLVLLYSLDVDGNPTTGTQLASFAAATPPRPLSLLSMAEVVARIGQLVPGRPALTSAAAVDLFVRQMDGEGWTQVAMDSFSGTVALTRGQGVASDGTYWYFSGTLSLEKTDLAFNPVKSNGLAIPPLLALAGSDHIGDIDVHNGQLYAPIEDGKKGYQSPKLVLYDTQNLSSASTHSIPRNLQTAGVPWVAVDSARGFLYFAEWNPTTQLNRFDLGNAQYVDSLPLTSPPGTVLGRIQGAKVFQGALYLASDDSGKTVYKLNLDTGTVLRLFSVATSGEQEGLAFLLRPDGSAMHTLNVEASMTGVELRHHRLTREPLRGQVCP